ncbi:Lrp/AsnC family transcriptional regulator [Asticcacaulis taihuensis]|uniref:Lrp/AsnC family transcriptional regulator n=1 Tax=Asticcacaulis taihuensis TaxID=260084 RepID=UPI0026F00CCA|nr:Lrp/AsnC family transcriptional regulator [Asticcacaulis taihuensis]
MLDDRDRKLLDLLQRDADSALTDLSERVNLSPSACSRRIARLREEGYIDRPVMVLDRARMNVATTVFVMVKTAHHTADWLERFRAGVIDIPEIVEVHRLAGNLDYIIKIVVTDIAHYDVIYKRLVSRIDLFDVSAYISMETLKNDLAVPTGYAS